MGPPGVAEIVPQQEGLEPSLGRLQIPAGLFPRAAQSADGFIVDGGDRNRGEVPCAPQPGELPSVTPVGCAPVARLCGHQGGGDDPADRAFVQPGALEPGAAGARFIDEDALLPLRLQLPSQRITSALPGSESTEGDDLCAMVLGDIGDRERLCVDISSDLKRARRLHG
jgi:hypothetical protein